MYDSKSSNGYQLIYEVEEKIMNAGTGELRFVKKVFSQLTFFDKCFESFENKNRNFSLEYGSNKRKSILFKPYQLPKYLRSWRKITGNVALNYILKPNKLCNDF